MTLFQELKRRNVIRVAIAYVLLGWAVLQGADFLLDLAGAPEWVIRAPKGARIAMSARADRAGVVRSEVTLD